MKTQQKFEYKINGVKRGYLLMPNEYDKALHLMKELDKSLEYVANYFGLSTNKMDSYSLKLTRKILG